MYKCPECSPESPYSQHHFLPLFPALPALILISLDELHYISWSGALKMKTVLSTAVCRAQVTSRPREHCIAIQMSSSTFQNVKKYSPNNYSKGVKLRNKNNHKRSLFVWS